MAVAVLLLLVPWLVKVLGDSRDISLHVTRQNAADLFAAEGIDKRECKQESCLGFSSGTATTAVGGDYCNCQCHSHLPAFREDLRICVDDIHECVLAPFVGGSTSQTIPFVFLPLKGQIIHPSKEISFAGIQTPVCAVSGAKFLTESGWVELRNPIDTDVPFRLFRDEGRTFLQWVGETDLRNKMSGRLVLVYLMCRELATSEPFNNNEEQTLFSPCVAFRVVGTPSKYLNNVSEVAFFPDSQITSDNSNHLSVSEYVAIGICSILLGLIYVASVFLYLHLRKRNRNSNDKINDNQNLGDVEEGVIKNNPLLTIPIHFQAPDSAYSDSASSDTDMTPDIIQHHDDRKKTIHQTSALVHPQYQRPTNFCSIAPLEMSHQDAASIEKLPEENVSIVETLEGREDRPDSFKALTGTVRKKLYFNPAYFEPQLLLAPPPAAIEFLSKIREVITIAKQKMASKKFSPSLLGIPEEDNNYALDSIYDYSRTSVSRRSSVISLKRENSRRKTCSGCPGCEPQDFQQLCGKLPEFPSLAACKNCASIANDSKQRSIRKWLEDVPVLKHQNNDSLKKQIKQRGPKRVRSPTRSLPPEGISTPIRALSPRPASERANSPDSQRFYRSQSKEYNFFNSKKSVKKPKAPPPPIPTNNINGISDNNNNNIIINNNHNEVEHQYDVIKEDKRDVIMNFPPPDMIHEAMVVDNKSEETRIPTLTKKQMKAVIDELNVQSAIVNGKTEILDKNKNIIDYETDSLERSTANKGYCTPSEYADVSSSQPSPSLSTALPMDEEVTMRNAIFNTKTGNMTISKINMDVLQEDDHDYELIVLKKGSLKKQGFYKLPELLQRNNGYSLVSEVYVNNGYNYNSAPSTPSESNCSTMDKRTLKVRYEEGVEKPGKLLIEVEDCPDNYIPVEDSDSFEPDTLDRKPSKNNINKSSKDTEYVDSLERPQQILLKSKGSFTNDNILIESTNINTDSNFNRVFGSLREIYEAKTKGLLKTDMNKNIEITTEFLEQTIDEGKLLTLEERHSKRQRRITNGNIVQPDVIPPPPHDNSPIYEHPKPPRKIIIDDDNMIMKPPLPPKNGNGRSASCKNTVDDSTLTTEPGTPVNNDYEICILQKQNVSILDKFIKADDIIFKKGINDQFLWHSKTSVPNNIDLMPTEKVFYNKNNAHIKRTWRKLIGKNLQHKPEDSGYLSTDSNESNKLKSKNNEKKVTIDKGSESEESLGDGHSESGAESIETHSVFFGSFRKPNTYLAFGSMDSGVDADTKPGLTMEEGQSSDSEPASYMTVVSLNKNGSITRKKNKANVH